MLPLLILINPGIFFYLGSVPNWILIPLFIFLIMPTRMVGQNRNTPYQTTKNYTSWQLGLVYPFLINSPPDCPHCSETVQYSFSDFHLNYGLHAGVGVGHSFNRTLGIQLAPFIEYSHFSTFTVQYDRFIIPQHSNQPIPLSQWIGPAHYYHIGIGCPMDFLFRINDQFELAVGGFVMKPFLDREYWDYTIEEYHPPRHSSGSYAYKNFRSEWRGGLHGKLSLKVNEREWIQKRIELEYYYSFERVNFYSRESWIMLSFKKIFFQ